MTILSPAELLLTRQAVVAGRASERFTERALDVSRAELRYTSGPNSGQITTQFTSKSGGFFALHLEPSRDMPDLSAATSVNLNLTLTLEDGTEETVTADVAASDLTPTDRTVRIDGRDYLTSHLPGAPVVMNWQADPAAVQLQGQVLLAGNPATPGIGLTVTVGAAPSTTTDTDGFFRTGDLPIAASVPVVISDGTNTVNLTHKTDFTTPLNTALFPFAPDTD